MKINSISSSILIPNINDYSQGNSQVQTSNDQFELSKMKQIIFPDVSKVADQQTNSINIKPGEVKNIGSVDGSPLNISFNADGMMSTSFSIVLNANDCVGCATPEQQFAADVFYSHSSAQQNKVNSIVSRFQLLNSVANGSKSVNQYNSTDLGQDTMSTSELLSSIGIDVSKSLSFNGKSFSLDSQGDLHALPASQLNVTQ